jgi:uncharacterized protein (DUF302 family)
VFGVRFDRFVRSYSRCLQTGRAAINKEHPMRKSFIFSLLTLCLAGTALAADGTVDVKSSHGVKATADRLEGIFKEKGMTVFNRIPHSEGAKKVGVEIRPTELLIFGNPKIGSALMKCQQSVAIDLPMKALVWEDASSQVWISYNDPAYLKGRHAIDGCDEVLGKVTKALAGMTGAAAK